MKEIELLKENNLEEELNMALISALSANTPTELIDSIIILKQGKDALKSAKLELKNFIKEPKEIMKAFENKLNAVEKEIKMRALETFKTETYLKQNINYDTGEITHTEKQKRNLGKKIFIFRKRSKSIIIDKDKITFETHPHLFKQVWVLDNEKLKEEDINNLPKKTIIKEPTIGIQYAAIGAKLEKGDE